jgi:hypothetical protein
MRGSRARARGWSVVVGTADWRVQLQGQHHLGLCPTCLPQVDPAAQGMLQPEAVLAHSVESLRACGLSQRKAE